MATKTKQKEGKAATKADKAQIVDKVNKLVALATGQEDTEEARTAAVQAAKLMKEHDLAVVDRAAVERARTYVEGLAKKAKDEKVSNIALGAVLGIMFGKKIAI